MDKVSPLLQHHATVRASLPASTLLLIRMGDFYEALDSDAETVAKALTLTLTKRQTRPMCGFGVWAADKMTKQLVAEGFTVALTDGPGKPLAVVCPPNS